jgi:hypothetical protein
MDIGQRMAGPTDSPVLREIAAIKFSCQNKITAQIYHWLKKRRSHAALRQKHGPDARSRRLFLRGPN